MTEDEVRRIAEQFVAKQALDRCQIVAIRRFRRSDLDQPTTIGDEWVVQFQFDLEEGVSASYACVIIDDATGEPQLLESL